MSAAHGSASAAEVARRLVDSLGGRYSSELGIDVDAGDAQVERWFVAATLFGTRISVAVAERTFRVLDAAGVTSIDQARHREWDELVSLLDEGGYARYDFRTATRLQRLAEAVYSEFDGSVSRLGSVFRSYPELRDALDALPGWGPVTVGLFLRELRGVWPGADPPLGERARKAASHLRICGSGEPRLDCLERLGASAGLDVRDLESGLVRLWLAHQRGADRCPGGSDCVALERSTTFVRPISAAICEVSTSTLPPDDTSCGERIEPTDPAVATPDGR